MSGSEADTSDHYADPSDVRKRLNLPDTDTTIGDTSGISNEGIKPYIDDAAFDIDQANPSANIADDVRMQLEWRLAGIKILSQRKGLRSYVEKSLGSSRTRFETGPIEQLRKEVKRICRDNGLELPIETDDPDFFFGAF